MAKGGGKTKVVDGECRQVHGDEIPYKDMRTFRLNQSSEIFIQSRKDNHAQKRAMRQQRINEKVKVARTVNRGMPYLARMVRSPEKRK